VLEERTLTRVGGSRPIEVEARVVAATNRDLESETEEGRFRRDLYYRLNVHIIQVPPLRERLSDLPALVDHFLGATCRRFGVRPMRPAAETLRLLEAYDWRMNNVRELRNIIERLVIATDGEEIPPEAVPPEIGGASGSEPPRGEGPLPLRELRKEAERSILLTALERNDWHITRTARELGLADHSSLLKILRRHGIRRP